MSETTGEKTVINLLDELAVVRDVIGRISADLSPFQQREAELRKEIHEQMQASGAKTVEGYGLQAVRSRRKSVVVVDEIALINHITDTGRESDYVKFDLIAARKDAAKNGWPGVEEVINDVFSIREVADAT